MYVWKYESFMIVLVTKMMFSDYSLVLHFSLRIVQIKEFIFVSLISGLNQAWSLILRRFLKFDNSSFIVSLNIVERDLDRNGLVRSGRQNLGIRGDDFCRFDQWLGLGLIVANFLSFDSNVLGNTLGEVFATFDGEIASDMVQKISLSPFFISLFIKMKDLESVLEGIQMDSL